MKAQFFTADVFTDRRFGGNQLAVFPNAGEIDPALMQDITREFNFSETTFVLPPDDPRHTARVRIFTPGGELAFAGHPTVGTAHVLAAAGKIPLVGEVTRIVFEEKVGPVPVSIRSKNGKPEFVQLTAAIAPEVGPPPPAPEKLAEVLSLPVDSLRSGEWSAQAVSCGTAFLFVPVVDRAAVSAARLDLAAWERTLSGYFTSKVFVFAEGAERPDSHIRARMFAPGIGVPEDPATGSAVAALAGYLGDRDKRTDGTLAWRVEQGFEMGRPSILDAEADKKHGKVVITRVGGQTVMMTEGVMEL
jgi:trans-2,3-dihydro-3-hydroxyanthranilate isomerase